MRVRTPLVQAKAAERTRNKWEVLVFRRSAGPLTNHVRKGLDRPPCRTLVLQRTGKNRYKIPANWERRNSRKGCERVIPTCFLIGDTIRGAARGRLRPTVT